MIKIKDLLAEKGKEVWSIGPAQSVYQAIEMMALKEVGALTVLDDSGQLIGIVSERDYARKVILKGKSSKDTHISDIMTESVITVGPDLKVKDCLGIMTDKKVRHLPVVEDGRLSGILSVGDLVKAIISEQGHLIGELERYIRGEAAVVNSSL